MAKQSGSMSEKVRQYLKDHPDTSAGEVATTLNVKPGLVYNIKARLRAKGKGRKRGRPKKAAAENGSVDQVVAAAKLIKACGGIESARQALRAAEQVATALEDR